MANPFTTIAIRRKTLPKFRRMLRHQFPRLGTAEAMDALVDRELARIKSDSQITADEETRSPGSNPSPLPGSTPATDLKSSSHGSKS